MKIERPVLRLMIAVGVPIACALVVEQLPKTGVAEVPFAFQVDGQELPAGTYSVKQAERGHSIRIQNDKLAGVGMECLAAKRKFGRANGARLVFDSDGGRYYLSEIWFAADGTGVVLQEGRANQPAGTPAVSRAGAPAANREVRYVRFQ